MKLIYLTNIPAPYRVKRFNDMVEVFNRENIDFEVWFMAENEPDRNWNVDYSAMKFKYKIWSGIHPRVCGFFAHFNPSLLYALKTTDYDLVIVAGMSCPTTWLAKMFIRKNATKVMSVETNLLGNTTKRGIKRIVKNFLLKNYDGYQVTGNPQIDYISFFSPSTVSSPKVILPNLIDGNRFNTIGGKVDWKKYGVETEKKICILPVRIIDFKLPIEFVKSTAKAQRTHFVVIGKGVGDYEHEIKQLVIDENLPISFVPFVQQEEMADIYRSADYFCLPSKTDASPLSPIEAIASGLPILVSQLIGNKAEVLEENVNGFSFNPYSEKDCAEKILAIEGISDQEIKIMGAASREIYDRIFDNSKCLENYAKGLKMIVKQNG